MTNPENIKRGRGFRFLHSCFVILLFPLGGIGASSFAAAPAEKTPAQWIAQLAADHLADRDAAGAALLALGAQARGPVHAALDSSDPEIRSRAQELWKTLRWYVIPGAEKDTAPLIPAKINTREEEKARLSKLLMFGNDPDLDASEDNKQQWLDFVKAHGAQTLLLLAEFHKADCELKSYRTGLQALLWQTKPEDLVKLIKEHPAETEDLLAPLDDHNAKVSSFNDADTVVRVLTAFGRFEKAFRYGRIASQRMGWADLSPACAVAVDRGGLFDKMEADAHKEIASDTDPANLCCALDFYASIMLDLNKKDRIPHLFDAPFAVDPATENYNDMQLLALTLMKAGCTERVALLLANAKEPMALCMRSVARLRMKQDAQADDDWRDAQAAADSEKDAWSRKSDYAQFADFMNNAGDPRTGAVWEKVLTLPPGHSVCDTNALSWLCWDAENKKNYAQAVAYYKKAIENAARDGGYTMVQDSDGRYEQINSREDYMQGELKRLEALAAKSPSK
ncbi:MAG TPA: hypothetical protein VG733_09110 [Chthoniobacteraceae bacterium]|nr:hypothetical protein [Chthoniobacteraceae bacterium]